MFLFPKKQSGHMLKPITMGNSNPLLENMEKF